MQIKVCPHCNEEMIFVRGPLDSPVLLLGEFPGEEELNQMMPFCGAAGMVLKNEFGRCGLDIKQMRITNLWRHKPNKNEDCLTYGHTLAVKAAQYKQAILLIGSESTKHFTGLSVMSVSGLVVKSDFFPDTELVMASVNPAVVFHGGVGEVRFAISRFAERIDGLL